MKTTEEELQKIKVAATLNGTLDEYVYLYEDEQGMYIKYACDKIKYSDKLKED